MNMLLCRSSITKFKLKSLMLKRWRIRILLFLAVLGPGFITANIDNDSGGILTYSNAGAQFGYTLLWTMIPITVALLVVQEMCARMGAVTGKGLSDLIREEFGLRMTFILMLLLVVVNFGNIMTEFIGIAGSMQLFHISKYISVPGQRVVDLVPGGQRRLQTGRKGFSGGVGFLHCLHRYRGAFAAQLARCNGGHHRAAKGLDMAL